MNTKRLISIAIAFSMLAVSFAMVAPQKAEAGFIQTGVGVPWAGTFTPKDMAWDDTGKYGVVVGQETSAASNVWAYNDYTKIWQGVITGSSTLQILNSVTWDQATLSFWICGDLTGSPLRTLHMLPRGSNVANAPPGTAPIGTIWNTIEASNAGIILIGGNSGSMYAYNPVGMSWYPYAAGTMWAMKSITYNTFNGRFYIAAYDGAGLKAGLLYSSPAPLTGSSTISPASTPLISVLNSIDWNPVENYGLAVGNGVYKVNSTFVWTTIKAPSTSTFFDVAWDANGWNEAAIFGANNVTKGIYCRYYHTNPTITLAYTDLSAGTPYYCGSIKPPASPKIVFIPFSGGIAANIQEFDQSTRITANAVFPRLYWIGFNDTLLNPRMEQQVAPDSNYVFTLQANYSLGWTGCDVVVQAWHDRGSTGIGSSYPNEQDRNRTLAFSINYNVLAGIASVTYPGAPEITVGAVTDNVWWVHTDPTQSIHRVQIPVWIGPQARSASGGGFVAPDSDYAKLKTSSLLDANSWDFSVSVRDVANPTALNCSYGEFGLQQAVSVSVSGNPSGNAPPGTIDNAMTSTSQITYSSNAQYWVNVSIPHLYKDGIVGPNYIPANNVSVQNIAMTVNATNSYISLARHFPIAPNTPMNVWGLNATKLNPTGNGTTSVGQWVTNFNAGGLGYNTYTELSWWVTVIAGTQEGIYWGVITIDIRN
jgi:hypothetical protein